MKPKYVKITFKGGTSYIQPISELLNALDGELDALVEEKSMTFTVETIDMTDREYWNLPEFEGH